MTHGGIGGPKSYRHVGKNAAARDYGPEEEKIDLIREDLPRANPGSNELMATVSKDTLLAAFVAFRDSLPANHNRRQALREITDLRFDTKDPTICHLLIKDQERIRQIDPSQPVEKIAEAMVLYPAHIAISVKIPAGGIDKAALHRQPPIRDFFLTDNGKIVLHLEEGGDRDVAMEMLDDAILLQQSVAKYIGVKILRPIVQSMLTGTSSNQQMPIEPKLNPEITRQIQLMTSENGEQLRALKSEMSGYLKSLWQLDQSDGTTFSEMVRSTLSAMFPSIWPMADDSCFLEYGIGGAPLEPIQL